MFKRILKYVAVLAGSFCVGKIIQKHVKRKQEETALKEAGVSVDATPTKAENH